MDEERIAKVIEEGGRIGGYSNLLSAYDFCLHTLAEEETIENADDLRIELDKQKRFILVSNMENNKEVVYSALSLTDSIHAYPCFRGIFPYLSDEHPLDCFMHLVVYTLEGHELDASGCRSCRNGTWMTKEQLEEHILYCKNELHMNFISKVFDLDDSVSAGSYSGKVLHVLLYFSKTMRSREIKFALTWIRYTYEFPDTLALLDAYRMKQSVFKEETLFNLFLMSAFLQRNIRGYRLPGDQIISDRGRFKTNSKLEKTLKEETGSLNSIYTSQRIDLPTVEIHIPNSYWAYNKGWEERLQFYNAYYKYQTSVFGIGASILGLSHILSTIIGKSEEVVVEKPANDVNPQPQQEVDRALLNLLKITVIIPLFGIFITTLISIFDKGRFGEICSRIGLGLVFYLTLSVLILTIVLIIRRRFRRGS